MERARELVKINMGMMIGPADFNILFELINNESLHIPQL